MLRADAVALDEAESRTGPPAALGRVKHTADALNWPASFQLMVQEVVTIRVMSSVTVVPDPQSCCPVNWPHPGDLAGGRRRSVYNQRKIGQSATYRSLGRRAIVHALDCG